MGNDRRIILLTRDIRIDEKFLTNHLAIYIKALGADVVAGAGIMATVITPGDDKPAIVQRRHRRFILSTSCPRINPELITDQCPRLIEQLGPDVITGAPVVAAAVRPGHHIITTGKTCHRRRILRP